MDSWFSELRSGTAPTSTRTSSLTTPISTTRKTKLKTSSRAPQASNFAARAKEKVGVEGSGKSEGKKKRRKKKASGDIAKGGGGRRPGTSGHLSDLNRVLRQQIVEQKETARSRSSLGHQEEPRSKSGSPLIWDIASPGGAKRSPINIMEGGVVPKPDRVASPIFVQVDDDDDDGDYMGFAQDEGMPLQQMKKQGSPLVRSSSSGAILGVRSGGADKRDAIMATLLNNMSFDDDNVSRRSSWDHASNSPVSSLLDMPRQTITDRPISASGKSRVSSAKLLRPQPHKVERTRNKSASLARRRESAVRRAVEAGKSSQHNGRELWMDGDNEVEREVVRPPSRQSNAFPMSLADPPAQSKAPTSPSKPSNNNQVQDQSEQDKVKLFQSKRPRPSSRKKPPAKSMFLNDAKLDSKREVVTPPQRTTTGWGEGSSPVVQQSQPPESKSIIPLRSGSPSNNSLGDPDDDVEFVLSPVPPTRVREIDERRDNPERDGFSEIEESGMYEIKIEVTTGREPIAEASSKKISERISPLGIGEEDEVVKNLTSSSDSDDVPIGSSGPGGREIGSLRHSRMIRTAPSTAAFLGSGGLSAPTPPDMRPDTVAATNIGDDRSSDGEFSEGRLSPAFTPVAKSPNKGWAEGGLEDDDLLLTSYNGDDGLDDLVDDVFELDTNLGTDFLSLFAPSPPPR